MGATTQIAATAMQVVGSIQQGRAAQQSSNYNAAIAVRNEGIARDQAQADAAASSRAANSHMGAMRAAYGASGVTMDGSPLDVLESSATLAELDKQNILYKGELKAMGYHDEAMLENQRGKNAVNQSYMNAGSNLITGLSKYKSQYGSDSSVGRVPEARAGQYSLSNPAYG